MKFSQSLFCLTLSFFFITPNILAQTSYAKKQHKTKNVVQTTNVKQSEAVAPATNSSIAIPAEQKAYIDSLPLTEHTKKILYDFAMSPEGQAALLQMTSASIAGPTGSSIATPIAFGADWGIIAGGLSYVNHWPTGTRSDGFASVTLGLGNAQKYAGLSVSALIDNLGGGSNRFAQNGTIAWQLFHVFPQNFALAVGMANAIPWGKAFVGSSQNYYGVATKVFDTRIKGYSMPLTASLGAGTGSFYSLAHSADKRDDKVKPFGSLGWRVLPRLSLISDWSANQLNAGVSIVPIKAWPLVINGAYANINRHQNTRSYFMISAAVGYSFK